MTTATTIRHFVKPPCFGTVVTIDTPTEHIALFQVYKDLGDGFTLMETSRGSTSEQDAIEMFNEWVKSPWNVVGTPDMKAPNHL